MSKVKDRKVRCTSCKELRDPKASCKNCTKCKSCNRLRIKSTDCTFCKICQFCKNLRRPGKKCSKCFKCPSCKHKRKKGLKCFNCSVCISCQDLYKNGTNCPRCEKCMTCANLKIIEKKCKNCSSHHTNPRSRGGMDGPQNEKELPNSRHIAHHNHNSNLSPSWIVCLILIAQNFNPYQQEKRPDVDADRLVNSKASWHLLYGKDATSVEATAIVINEFTVGKEDKEEIREVLKNALTLKKITKVEYEYLLNLL